MTLRMVAVGIPRPSGWQCSPVRARAGTARTGVERRAGRRYLDRGAGDRGGGSGRLQGGHMKDNVPVRYERTNPLVMFDDLRTEFEHMFDRPWGMFNWQLRLAQHAWEPKLDCF